jgi:phosphopantothenoylcysteine decarboxylase/phosphopantothenate--cysteine ligase
MPPITVLENKRIILAVTGSIAIYKAVDLASKLTQAGAVVDVVMTESARRFVTPLTFQSVTGRPVYTDLWQSDTSGGLPTHIAHVGLGEGADLLAVIPSTANTIAKLAAGLADDLLSVTALAARCPLLIAPAMDGGMYSHPALQENLNTLVERGGVVIEPDEGRFASGLHGKGRLPDTPTLMGRIRSLLGRDGSLAGRTVVISAGGTREPLDPVRYITNHSSGKQGYAVAQAAIDAGATVLLISTVEGMPLPVGATVIPVETAQQMHDAVLFHIQEADADALVMAAAVADYRPATRAEQKIKKGTSDSDGFSLDLVRNPDILMSVKGLRESRGLPRIVVGFAAESENLLDNARNKLEHKGVDLLVANDISASDAGFQSNANRVTVLSADGTTTSFDLQSKAWVGEMIIEKVATLL